MLLLWIATKSADLHASTLVDTFHEHVFLASSAFGIAPFDHRDLDWRATGASVPAAPFERFDALFGVGVAMIIPALPAVDSRNRCDKRVRNECSTKKRRRAQGSRHDATQQLKGERSAR